jgi:hypothetical protein
MRYLGGGLDISVWEGEARRGGPAPGGGKKDPCPSIAVVSARIRRSSRKLKKPYLPYVAKPVLHVEDELDNRTKA